MGYEKTLPSNHLIAIFTALSVVLLAGLHFVFTSYFDRVTTQEVSDKVLTVEPVKLNRLRDDEARRLTAANIDNSMRAIAGGTRPAALTPQKGVDLEARLSQLGAVSGWAEDSRPLALATARRDEAVTYLREMQASVAKAQAEGNKEALDTLLPRLQTAKEAVVRLEKEAQEILGNQLEAGVTKTIRNDEETPAGGTPEETPVEPAPSQEAPKAPVADAGAERAPR